MTVVIPVTNNNDIHPSIRNLITRNTELHAIVVDQTGDSSFRTIVGGNSRIISFPGPVGLSNARNQGFTAATTEWIAFIDADVDISGIDWVETEKVLNSTTYINAACFRISDPMNGEIFGGDQGEVLSSPFQYKLFCGAALALKKRGFSSQPFDERFGIGSKLFACEETELFFRYVSAGGKVQRLQQTVFHAYETEPATKVWRYRIGAGALCCRTILDSRYSLKCTIALLRNFCGEVLLLPAKCIMVPRRAGIFMIKPFAFVAGFFKVIKEWEK